MRRAKPDSDEEKVFAYMRSRLFPWNFIVEDVDLESLRHFVPYAIRICEDRGIKKGSIERESAREVIERELKWMLNDYLHAEARGTEAFAFAQALMHTILYRLGVSLEEIVNIKALGGLLELDIEDMRRRIEEKLPSQVREEIEKATCVLSGVVIDVVEDKPVQGAEVILMNKKTYKVYTDENGRFAIANIEPGRYKLIIKAKNYATWVREVELRSGDYLELTIAMEPLKPRVRDVVATATITATPLLLAFISALAKKW